MTDHKTVTRLTRSGLAEATGCNLETIRYYEKIGLMPNPPRTAGGYRIYENFHVSRLGFILRARALGFDIAQTRELLNLVDGGAQTCAEVKTLTDRHIAEVRAKISDLRRIESALATTAAKCSGDDIPECPILEALAS